MFLYEIGQVLQLRVAKTWRFQVLERIALECSAGVQRFYQGRLYKAGENHWYSEGDNKPIRVYYSPVKEYDQYHELELEPVPQADSQE